jgi:hypothetical protein
MARPRTADRGLNSRKRGEAPAGSHEELEPIAPRIGDEEAPCDARYRLVVVLDGHAPRSEPRAEAFERRSICQPQAWMRLLRGAKLCLYTNVDLLCSALKPAPSARGQRRRLRDLFEPEQATIECSRFCLASRRRRELNVVDSDE